MKHYIFSMMAVAALLVAGCRHREVPAPDYYQGGVSAAEVSRTVEAEGYDFALMAVTKQNQLVTYGWRDSLHFLSVQYGDSLDGTQSDYASDQSLADEGITLQPVNDSLWVIQVQSVPRWVLNIKLGWTRVTTDGVEFDVHCWGVPMAHCTFVCDDPTLLSARLLDEPAVQELVLHVVFVKLLSGDLDDLDDIDDWDDFKEQIREARQAKGRHAVIDTVFVSHGCSADRSFDRLERQANKLGFGSFELHHQEGHEGCYMQVTHGLGGVKKCHRRMEKMSMAAGEEGMAYRIQHNGDPHTTCTFRAWKADK